MLRKVAIIVAGVAVLLGSIAYSKAKDSQSEAKDKVQLAAPTEPAAEAAAKENQYWIGVRCVAPVPEMVRAHAEVPDDSGIFVAEVLPEGPAAAAGLKRHDVILAVGDKPVKAVADLIAAVGKSQGEKLTLKILRGGKQQDVALAPQKRLEEFDSKGPVAMPPGSKWQKLGKYFDQSRPGMDGRPPLRMRFMHPGMILPPLPAGMTVTVTRQGDEPAKITVKKGDKTWELTADDMDKLPDDVRPHVERMIGGLSATQPIAPGALSPQMLHDKLKMPDPAEIEKSVQNSIQKQIDAMSRQMKKLEKMADDLRKERALFMEQKKSEPQSKAKAEKPAQPEKENK